MKFSKVIFVYHFLFKIANPHIQKLVQELERIALSWTGVSSGIHTMGGKAFMLYGKEIGHIHWNGDLDILLGRQLTAKLVGLHLAQAHNIVSEVAITFSLQSTEHLPTAVSLLRFSYLRILAKLADTDLELKTYVERESATLPSELKQLL